MKHFMRHTSTIIFLSGFLVDMFLLPEVDDPLTKWIGLGYLLTIALAIYLREAVVAMNQASAIEQKIFSILTFGIAFFSGSALSFVFVYYFRSAELAVSWPFFVMLIGVMIMNEFVSTHNFRYTLDVAVWMVATIFYAIFNVPLLTKAVNDQMFIISIGISTFATLLYLYILKYASETSLLFEKKMQALAVVVPLAVAFLYFSNVIPAVPLALKDAGVYHSITRLPNGEYQLDGKESVRFPIFQTVTYHIKPTDNGVYFYNAVHAPVNLVAPITHVWEYYNQSTNSWSKRATIAFTLSGGREEGYRSYSNIEHVEEGLWRVTVKVGNNRVIGRMTFNVVKD